jgi:FG-GAP-like repeat/Abnormal spindle-like microcephaly-assoc'd, ASPM-SPD-2-Hydin/FG-GAP repeat
VSTVVALLWFIAACAPAWAQFETRATNSTLPYGAWSIATGDFNHDGRLDVVVTVDGGFAVALGNGDGTLQKAVFYSTQLSYALAVGDFNNDGNLDILVANENLNPSTVSVYLGNGDGTFRSPIDSNTTSDNSFVVVGDFNGDGKQDIAVIDNPYISVLLGNGDGTFQPPSDNNSFLGAKWLAVADFNNDRKLDVLVTGDFGGSYNIGVLLGNGDGTLQSSITQSVDFVPASVATGDLNRDGKMDAVLGYDLDGIAVLLGNGDGTLQSPVIYNTTGLGGGEVVVSDMNLDGKLDVAVPSGVGVDIFWGNGDGTLQPAQFFASGETGLPAVGDFNGDHLPDLALSNAAFTTTMLNTGVASFSPTAPIVFPSQLFNTKSAAQVLTLTNIGTAPLSISSITVSGQFQVSDTCGSSLAAGAKCNISAAFQPKSAGKHTGLITLIDGASSKPQVIEVSGNGTAIKVSPTNLRFGSQKVGTKSAPQVLTATNEGSKAVQFGNAYIGGKDKKDFTETDTCSGQTIQPGASCTAMVTFTPTKTGARSATFNFMTQGTSPAPATLTGTGT